jgi:hypothetical protein
MGPANRLLAVADQCVLSPGPAWLFKVREPGLATEVRGKVVRPAFAYVLLVRANLPKKPRGSQKPTIDTPIGDHGGDEASEHRRRSLPWAPPVLTG